VTCDPRPRHTRRQCTPISPPGWTAVGKHITSFGSLARLSRLHPTQPERPIPLKTGTQAHRHTGTQQWNGLRERDQGALVALVTRARTAARPESTEIAMSGWPMEQVPRKLTAGISFPGKKNAAVAMKQLRLLSRGHVHTDTLPALFVHCHGIIRLSLSAPEIRQGSVSPERGTRVPRRRRRDRNPSMPLIAGPSQHSRASSARDCPSGSGPRLCDRKSPLS